MKLTVPTLYSQRDNRWSSVLLGFNANLPYTIGNYGCLITSLAMYGCAVGFEETPVTINNMLKDLGAGVGFTAGSGNFVWSAISKLFTGVQFEYSSPKYVAAVPDEGLSKMRSLLDAGKALLCEIDFNPTTVSEEMHFVLVHGYGDGETFYACDPWTGTEIDLAVYGGVRRTIISFKALSKPLQKGGTIAIPTTTFELLVTKATIKDEITRYLLPETDPDLINLDQLKNIIAGIKSRNTDLQNQLTVAQTEVTNRTEQVSRLKTDIASLENAQKLLLEQCNNTVKEMQKTLSLTQGQVTEKQSTITEQAKRIGTLNTEVALLKAKQEYKVIRSIKIAGVTFKLIEMR